MSVGEIQIGSLRLATELEVETTCATLFFFCGTIARLMMLVANRRSCG